jgi:NADP-dependent 3-hydroxy acid dehydrogenase YdfG
MPSSRNQAGSVGTRAALVAKALAGKASVKAASAKAAAGKAVAARAGAGKAAAGEALAGKVVAVTGGARGIGRAVADALAGAGARVAIGDVDLQAADNAAKEIGRGVLALPLDVSDPDSFERFLDEVEARLGALDVLVNNAGIMNVGPFVTESQDTARRMVDINLHGVIIGSRLALRRMLPRGSGHLVNVASQAGKVPAAGGATYSATKHAVVGLSETIRQEIRGTGVRISLVLPSAVNTELATGLAHTRGVPVVQPADVATAILQALARPRFEVYVPRSMGALINSGHFYPRPAREAIGRLMGTNDLLGKADLTARTAYEERAARTPSPDPET